MAVKSKSRKGEAVEEMEVKAPAVPSSLEPRGVGASVLTLVFPGLGHAYLRRFGRAAVYAGVVLGFLALGLLDRGGLYSPRPGEPLTYLAFLGNLGVGPLYWLIDWLGLGVAVPDEPTFEYGSTFILSAGLMNYLVMLDAYDIGAGFRE